MNYFSGRIASTLLVKPTVSHFTVSVSLLSLEKHPLWPVCWMFLASAYPYAPPSHLPSVAVLQLPPTHLTCTLLLHPASNFLHSSSAWLRFTVVLRCLRSRC